MLQYFLIFIVQLDFAMLMIDIYNSINPKLFLSDFRQKNVGFSSLYFDNVGFSSLYFDRPKKVKFIECLDYNYSNCYDICGETIWILTHILIIEMYVDIAYIVHLKMNNIYLNIFKLLR